MNGPPLVCSGPVAAARGEGGPIVALESTIIAHGLPFPDNLETARALEAEVAASGAVPATVAVLDGRIHVGLDGAALERIARDPVLPKLSRRDLAAAIAAGSSGATTVAATMIAAALADIAVFATGGIGGVHRGAAESFDVSADLDELARTPVCVVSAGFKAILDLPRTMEVLETKGVPVIGYRTDELPAFYSRESGLAVPQRADTPEEVAAVIRTQRALGLRSGIVVAVPAPDEAALPRDEVDGAIEAALAAAAIAGIAGKEVTPFLLREVVERTGGRALRANIALARNNASIAGRIAVVLARTG